LFAFGALGKLVGTARTGGGQGKIFGANKKREGKRGRVGTKPYENDGWWENLLVKI